MRDYDDPVPPEVSNLDLVTIYFSYHDLVHMGIDRAAMNKKVFAALKPGGYLRRRGSLGQEPATEFR